MKDARDGGRPVKDFKQAAAVAKLYATESAVTATRIATQVFGGYGFMEEYPVARLLPRRQGARDRRGHLRGAADADRPRPRPAGRVEPADGYGEACVEAECSPSSRPAVSAAGWTCSPANGPSRPCRSPASSSSWTSRCRTSTHSGISDVWLSLQFQGSSLQDEVANGRPWDLDRNLGGLRLLLPHEGTGGLDEEGFARGNADELFRLRDEIGGVRPRRGAGDERRPRLPAGLQGRPRDAPAARRRVHRGHDRGARGRGRRRPRRASSTTTTAG